jgi:hypothetical protein
VTDIFFISLSFFVVKVSQAAAAALQLLLSEISRVLFPPPPQQQQQQDVSILDFWSCTLFLALFDSHFNAVILVVLCRVLPPYSTFFFWRTLLNASAVSRSLEVVVDCFDWRF